MSDGCHFLFSLADDHSRVKLQNVENDYINASLVVMEEAQRNYILTQVTIEKMQLLSKPILLVETRSVVIGAPKHTCCSLWA